MWLKKCFFEPACRIPLIVSAPFLFAGRRVAEPVSLVDLLPTLLGLAGDGAAPEPIEPLDGLDLTGALAGGGLPERPLLGEILGEGTPAPVLMVRRGRHKYVSCPLDPPQLYDLEADPDEVDNLAGRAEAAEVEAAFAAETAATWDIEALDAAIRLSQRRRLLIQRAHGTGRPPVWDHLPGGEADEGWFRGQSSYGDWAFDYE
jgi:choline-sulfatase